MQQAEANEDYMKLITTSDEMWVCEYNVEKKKKGSNICNGSRNHPQDRV
jgi:hypothetical protein